MPSAERFPVCEAVEAGDVLVNDLLHPGAFCLGRTAADPGVVGVARETTSAAPAGADTLVPVATGGIVLCKSDATLSPIRPNDLLVTSPLPGHAMRAPRPIEPGTVIGKALEPLESGTGVIKVLLMLR
jgi:hypothetical protein